MVNRNYILSTYGISEEFGFLSTDIIDELPLAYKEWEEMVRNLPTLLRQNKWREAADTMPVLQADFGPKSEWKRAQLILSYMGHAYVFSGNSPVDYLPPSIAKPWVEVANHLGLPPVITHSSGVLNNWKLKDIEAPFSAENLEVRIRFDDSEDENWFFMLTAMIEKEGAKGISACVDAILAVEKDNDQEADFALSELDKTLRQMTHTLSRMKEHCDPYRFFHELRPFLSSFEKIEYRGIIEEPVRSYHGGSAAQSTLIQLFDATLGIRHQGTYLQEMRKYMPPQHANFLRFIQMKSKVKNYCGMHRGLHGIYDQCVSSLREFRNEHLKIAAEYIMGQKPKEQEHIKGTGGTNPMIFLKELRDDTE